MLVEAPKAVVLSPLEEEATLAALLGGLSGDERGVKLEETGLG